MGAILYKFNAGHLGAVALAALAELYDAEVAAGAAGIARAILTIKLVGNLLIANAAHDDAARGERLLLCKGHQAFHRRADFLGAGFRRFNGARTDQVVREVAQKRAARTTQTAEFSSYFRVTHCFGK